MEVYQGVGELPDELDQNEGDTAGRAEYTLSNGGMLQEPSADEDEQGPRPPKAHSLKAEADNEEKPQAQAYSRTSRMDEQSRNAKEGLQLS